MPVPSGFDVPSVVVHFLDVVEYILFRLFVFGSCVFALRRLIKTEWRKR